jgi:hypothetical protein
MLDIVCPQELNALLSEMEEQLKRKLNAIESNNKAAVAEMKDKFRSKFSLYLKDQVMQPSAYDLQRKLDEIKSDILSQFSKLKNIGEPVFWERFRSSLAEVHNFLMILSRNIKNRATFPGNRKDLHRTC